MTDLSPNRFVTGLAGPQYMPIDVLNIDLDAWQLDPSAVSGVDLTTPGSTNSWTPPSGKVIAGVRIVLTGGSNDSVIRFGGYTDERLAAANGVLGDMLAAGPIFKVGAGQMVEFVFSLPANRKFGLIVETGGLTAHELHWMNGV